MKELEILLKKKEEQKRTDNDERKVMFPFTFVLRFLSWACLTTITALEFILDASTRRKLKRLCLIAHFELIELFNYDSQFKCELKSGDGDFVIACFIRGKWQLT